MKGFGRVLKVYRASEYEYDHEILLNKIDQLILNHKLEQKVICLKDHNDIEFANLPHMTNLFALDIIKTIFIQIMFTIKDMKIYDYLDK